jgi:hypothetical protein
MDPCVRKSTLPIPVSAHYKDNKELPIIDMGAVSPKRKLQSLLENCKESKKIKIDESFKELVKDLELEDTDCEEESEVKQLVEEETKEKDSSEVKQVVEEETKEKDSIVEVTQGIEKIVKDKEILKLQENGKNTNDIDKLKNTDCEEESEVKQIVEEETKEKDSIVEVIQGIEKIVKDKEILTLQEMGKNVNDIDKLKKKQKKKTDKIKSIEFIEDLPETTGTQRKLCTYIFKKKQRKGEQCTNLTDKSLCTLHVPKTNKEKNGESSKVKISKLEGVVHGMRRTIRDLEMHVQELENKIKEKETTELKCRMESLENKINLKTKVQSENHKFTKFHKLIKTDSYKLVGYHSNNNAILQTKNEKIIVKLPNGLEKPAVEEDLSLVFNTYKTMFEWRKEN